ncbi:MAG: hypothetical protein IK129_02200 [Deltaproteobacteria bacterium]|nr:hypothetical protein [Deltaproteobacteria bacterium]
MYFIPLNQTESVQMVINALRIAGGSSDCSLCPASRVCSKQCLAVADAVASMLERDILPVVDAWPTSEKTSKNGQNDSCASRPGTRSSLHIVK